MEPGAPPLEHRQAAKDLKGARFALWKNPGRLTERQQLRLAQIQQTNKPLYRAYLISQQLRQIYRVPHEEATQLLDAWLAWARRSRLAPFVKLAKTITKQRPGIEAAIQHGLSNARTEQVNTQLRLITRRAFGFHTPKALIALAMLSLGGSRAVNAAAARLRARLRGADRDPTGGVSFRPAPRGQFSTGLDSA